MNLSTILDLQDQSLSRNVTHHNHQPLQKEHQQQYLSLLN